jgi:pimeloyl-ACP methyl ester carboxylesterase
MPHVTSKDGTRIGYDVAGSGDPIVLVSGGSVDRGSNAGLAAALAGQYTTYNYDRRGRGDSGDRGYEAYAIDREIEDIEAVIDVAGGRAALYGSSSGAALALLAASKLGDKVTKLVLWEPPYIVGDARPRPRADLADYFAGLVADGKRDAAARYFMSDVVMLPPEFVTMAESSPWWPGQMALAHTLAYDATVMGQYEVPAEAAARVKIPTIVFTGGGSFGFLESAAKALVEALPDGRMETLPGQEHNVDPTVLGPAIQQFVG